MISSRTLYLAPFSLLFLLLVGGDVASACDLCSVYCSVESHKPVAKRFQIGFAEQFTEYGTIKTEGHTIENEMHQRMNSSISQLFGVYDFSDRVGLQLTLPYISRRFARVEGEGLERGTEAGIGDMSIIARILAVQMRDEDLLFNLHLTGGVKLPTGNTDRLREELEEHHATSDDDLVLEDSHDHTEHSVVRHGDEDHGDMMMESVVHGHDLALGSGSVDLPLGFSILVEKGSAFLKGGLSYTVRTRGDHEYEYADDLMWNVGPAYYMRREQASSVALRVALSGEHKGKDTGRGGVRQDDTGTSSVFIGPELIVSMKETLSLEAGLDLPLDINNTGTQAVADYRLRAGISYVF